MDEKFYNQLKRIKVKDWELVRTVPRKRSYWNFRNEWWNIKFYVRGSNLNDDDGFEEQEVFELNGKKEAPYKRDMFKKVERRFSLQGEAVAYFSCNWIIATCETVLAFRNNERLTCINELKPYLNDKLDPDVGYADSSIKPSTGYPMSFVIKDDSSILDLRNIDNIFYEILQSNGIVSSTEEFYKKIIFGREKGKIMDDIYPKTQAIAQIAYDNNFHGVAYNSVRCPIDATINGHNIVLFYKDKLDKKI